MAINDVRLFGQLTEAPVYYVRKGADMPHKIIFTVKTLSRYFNSKDRDRLMFDEVVVMTQAPDMIQQIGKELHKNDIVFIKGMLCTSDVARKIICEKCEEQFQEDGVTTYVHPINIYVAKNNLTDKEGNMLIQKNVEVSNEVIMDGVVCSDIHYIEEKHYAYYKLAVKRSFHILEDPPDKKLDFPAINTYFEQAESDYNCLHKKSRINVKGAIRVRAIERQVACPYCETLNTIPLRVLEVVASNISYTANWESPEKEETEEVSNESIINNIEAPEKGDE